MDIGTILIKQIQIAELAGLKVRLVDGTMVEFIDPEDDWESEGGATDDDDEDDE